MKQSGQVPEKLLFYLVGFLIALMAFSFVFDQGTRAGIPNEISYVFAFLAFVAVLAFFIEELRVVIKVILKPLARGS